MTDHEQLELKNLEVAIQNLLKIAHDLFHELINSRSATREMKTPTVVLTSPLSRMCNIAIMKGYWGQPTDNVNKIEHWSKERYHNLKV